MRWTCLKSLILSLGRLCPENLTGSGYWWDFLHFKSHERQDWAALSICAIWVNPEQAILHQSVGRCTHPSVPLVICGAVPCVTRLSCPPATGWDCARNHRRRTTGRKFSGVVLRKMKILAERLKKYCCGFIDRHRLPGWDGSLPGVPMQVWVPSAQVLFWGCSAHCMVPCSLKSWGVLYAQSLCTFIFAL